MNDGFKKFIAASRRDRLDIFLSASRRLGAAVQNVEKDFWVCWTLDALYHRLPPGSPRLLFKGGTSLSKAHSLIRRFSEDIDITVFRDDLNQAASIADMEKLSRKKRKAKLDAIRDACRAWIGESLREGLTAQIKEIESGAGIPEAAEFSHAMRQRVAPCLVGPTGPWACSQRVAHLGPASVSEPSSRIGSFSTLETTNQQSRSGTQI